MKSEPNTSRIGIFTDKLCEFDIPHKSTLCFSDNISYLRYFNLIF